MAIVSLVTKCPKPFIIKMIRFLFPEKVIKKLLSDAL